MTGGVQQREGAWEDACCKWLNVSSSVLCVCLLLVSWGPSGRPPGFCLSEDRQRNSSRFRDVFLNSLSTRNIFSPSSARLSAAFTVCWEIWMTGSCRMSSSTFNPRVILLLKLILKFSQYLEKYCRANPLATNRVCLFDESDRIWKWPNKETHKGSAHNK